MNLGRQTPGNRRRPRLGAGPGKHEIVSADTVGWSWEEVMAKGTPSRHGCFPLLHSVGWGTELRRHVLRSILHTHKSTMRSWKSSVTGLGANIYNIGECGTTCGTLP